jgi:copper resistance protein C
MYTPVSPLDRTLPAASPAVPHTAQHPGSLTDQPTAWPARRARPAAGPAAGTHPAGPRRSRGRGLGGAAAAALLALAAATATAAPALAHDQLLSTAPAADSTVATAPDELSLTFSGNLITGQGIQNVVTVTDEAGHQWQDGDAQVAGPELTSALCEGLPNGDYDVSYRVVYSDGHSEAKQYGFTVDDPAAPDTAVPQGCGVPNPDAPVSSGQTPTPAGTGSPAGATGGGAPADPGNDDGAGAGAEPAPATLDTPAPLAGDQSDAADAEAASAADQAGVSAWVWVVGILGVLLVAAAVVFVFRRARAIDGPSGGRPGSEG